MGICIGGLNNMILDGVKITERGWSGHYIMSYRCLFRRNTLLEYNDKKWVVSSVGNRINKDFKEFETIGCKIWFETSAFEAYIDDNYIEADVTKEIDIDSEHYMIADTREELWIKYGENGVDNYANNMHDKVVEEMCRKIKEIN